MLIDLKIREDLLEYFPNYEYFNCTQPERINFALPNNLVGQQQESFITYHILQQLKNFKEVCMGGLDIGCGQNIHFASLGTDSYFGDNHPIYSGKYTPHITSQAETIHEKINPESLGWIIASHILEHVNNPIVTFRNWCKLLKKDGIVILLMPDFTFEKSVVAWDPSHKTFWTPQDFENNCIIPNQDLIKVEEFNTLNNSFSMNLIARKI